MTTESCLTKSPLMEETTPPNPPNRSLDNNPMCQSRMFAHFMEGIANCIFDRRDPEHNTHTHYNYNHDNYLREFFNDMKLSDIDFFVRKYEDRILDMIGFGRLVDRVEEMIVGMESGQWDDSRR